MSGGGGNASASRASSGTRAGARAGRIVRIIRIVRLVRLVKLYKYIQKAQDLKKNSNNAASKVATSGDDDDLLLQQSNVGTLMTDLTTQRVIILVLALLIVIPVLIFDVSDLSRDFAVEVYHDFICANYSSHGQYNPGLNASLAYMLLHTPLIGLYVDMSGKSTLTVYADNAKLNGLRDVESYYVAFSNSYGNISTSALFDDRNSSVQGALYAIYMTLFICALLVIGTSYFSSDVNVLVISPIEKMVDLVKKISVNPLGVEYKMLGADDGFIEGMETTLLLQTINKIGGLMRVGFGEAGASVIQRNLSEATGGKLNLMGKGNKIVSIFGFCDVRQFTDTTECLQEEVMLFVNRIAHILHSIVAQCSGAANKNIGDAFLLTWKLENDDEQAKTALADQALLAFCKTMIELGRYQDFICDFSVAATARLYKRFPGYKVRIGSGLHVGWAVEGAIGSNRKIDASYLSPHVNMTEFLESSTKAYGVPLLISEPFYNLLSPQAKKYVRQVDRLRRTEAEEPFGMYTYDMDLSIDFAEDGGHSTTNTTAVSTVQKVARRASVGGIPAMKQVAEDVKKKTDIEKGNAESDQPMKKGAPTIIVQPYTTKVWETDPEVKLLRRQINETFRASWNDGINAFINGDWAKARDLFEETMQRSDGKDGPSNFLIAIIDEHSGTAPHDWPGFRTEGGGH